MLASLALLLSCIAPAVAGTCTIRGTVTDADGVAIPGADVTLFDADRSELTSVKTDSSGNFAFTNVYVSSNLCTVRVFYNDRHQTYTNAAYFTEWYDANGDHTVPLKDTWLNTYHKNPTPTTGSGSNSPINTPGYTILLALVAIFAAVALKKN